MNKKLFLQRELVKKRMEKNMKKVINKWKVVTKSSKNYDEAFISFIDLYGNLGEAQLVRLKNEKYNIHRDFAITLEPKEEDLNKYNIVLRHIAYNGKTRDGLHSNKIGTVIFGKYELGEFDLLWNEIEGRMVGESKVY